MWRSTVNKSSGFDPSRHPGKVAAMSLSTPCPMYLQEKIFIILELMQMPWTSTGARVPHDFVQCRMKSEVRNSLGNEFLNSETATMSCPLAIRWSVRQSREVCNFAYWSKTCMSDRFMKKHLQLEILWGCFCHMYVSWVWFSSAGQKNQLS